MLKEKAYRDAWIDKASGAVERAVDLATVVTARQPRR